MSKALLALKFFKSTFFPVIILESFFFFYGYFQMCVKSNFHMQNGGTKIQYSETASVHTEKNNSHQEFVKNRVSRDRHPHSHGSVSPALRDVRCGSTRDPRYGG